MFMEWINLGFKYLFMGVGGYYKLVVVGGLEYDQYVQSIEVYDL